MPNDTVERPADVLRLDQETERRRMLIIVNPYATTVSDRLRHLVISALQGRYDVTAVDTQRKDHATEICREAAAEGYDVVVAFGGDGTVNEAANGLAGSDVPLTCLPGGRTNVFCRLLGIPNDIVDATEHLLRIADAWEVRRVDLPSVNGRNYTFSSGVGIDASVVEHVDRHPRLKTRLGAWYFAWSAVAAFLTRYVRNPPRLEVELPDGTRLAGASAIVQNTGTFTYFHTRPVTLIEGGTLDDGVLGGVALRTTRPTVLPGVVFRILSHRAKVTGHRAVDGFSGVTGLVVRSTDGRAIPVEVDGDYIGDVTEARYAIAPRALAVIA